MVRYRKHATFYLFTAWWMSRWVLNGLKCGNCADWSSLCMTSHTSHKQSVQLDLSPVCVPSRYGPHNLCDPYMACDPCVVTQLARAGGVVNTLFYLFKRGSCLYRRSVRSFWSAQPERSVSSHTTIYLYLLCMIRTCLCTGDPYRTDC